MSENRTGSTYRIWFPDTKIKSKLRPRFRSLSEQERENRANKKGIPLSEQPDQIVHLDSEYKKWKEGSIESIQFAVSGEEVFGRDWSVPAGIGDLVFPTKALDVKIDIFGSHRGDRDNQMGALVDALVGAKVLGEIDKHGKEHYADAPSFMPSGGYTSWKSSRQKGALITLTQLEKHPSFFEDEKLRELFENQDNDTDFVWIPGKCFSKLRPRGNKGWVGNDSNYVAWKRSHSSSIRAKRKIMRPFEFTTTRCMFLNGSCLSNNELLHVDASFIGTGHGGDCDNRFSALLDLLVDAEIRKNDGVNCIPHGAFRCYRSKSLFGTLLKISKQPILSGNNLFLEYTKLGFHDTSDLISQGWTKGLISKFLGKPDEIRDHPNRANKYLDLFASSRVKKIITENNLVPQLNNNLAKKKI